jgi:hypothetical protein
MRGFAQRHGFGMHRSPMRAGLAARLAPWVGEVGSPTAHAREHLKELRNGDGGQTG